jgi:hypothetical protein
MTSDDVGDEQQDDSIEVEPARQPVQTADVLKILNQLGSNLHKVVWDILNGSMTHDRELEFGDLLIEAGTVVKAHARNVRWVVLDGDGGE